MAGVVRGALIVIGVAGLWFALPAAAVTCTWTGLINGNWSQIGNWSGCTVPASGIDVDLVFPNVLAPATKAMNQDIANLSVRSLSFTGASGGYSLTGTGNLRISGAAAITSKAQNPNPNTLALTNALKFGAPVATVDTSGSGTGIVLKLNGPIDLNGSTLNFVWDAPVPYTVVNGAIGGAGGLSINGFGADIGLQLYGNSTFNGPVDVVTGYLGIYHANALGAGGSEADGTTVHASGTLVIGADIPGETLMLEGGEGQVGNGMMQSDGFWTWGGPVTLLGTPAALTTFNLLIHAIEFTGILSGPGGIQCCNGPAGRIGLSPAGTGVNVYSGDTQILGAGGTLRSGDHGLSANSAISLNPSGAGLATLDMQGFSAAAGGLATGSNAKLIIDIGQTLQTSGDVTLGGGALQLAQAGATPPVGTALKIIDNQKPGGATSGTFTGLPEGAALSVGTTGMTISYQGGDGNDVTLNVTSGTYQISVTRPGSGGGLVTANAGAINCGATCSDVYPSGTQLELSAIPDANSVFTGWLGPCTGTGKCKFTVAGSTVVKATFAKTPLDPHILDIDANGAYDAMTDALLVVRYMSGFSGSNLTNNAIGGGATRSMAADVASYLLDIAPLLDIDGDGAIDPNTDGALIIRYLIGLRGDALIADAIGKTATRFQSGDIEKQIGTLIP